MKDLSSYTLVYEMKKTKTYERNVTQNRVSEIY